MRHEPNDVINAEIKMEPTAAPSGAPPSISEAPRVRSLRVSHNALSLPPAGAIAASENPRPNRMSSRDRALVQNPAPAWNAPQISVATVITRRGLKRSTSMPEGICMSVYDQKNELRMSPCMTGDSVNSLAISGIATESEARST
jgi:hypothetical protein